MSAEDKMYERQMRDANVLGNALLTGLLADSISESKKAIKISLSLKNLRELIENYKKEVDSLRSLQIGSCFDILEIKENSDFSVQIKAAARLLKKIDDILKSHVKHNASHIISKDDLKLLKEQLTLMVSMQEQLEQLPKSREDLREHLAMIDDIQSNLVKITSSVDSSKAKVASLQHEIVTEATNAFYFSS